MRSAKFEFVGVMSIFLVAAVFGVAIRLTQYYGVDLVVMNKMHPWIAEHAEYIRWIAMGAIAITVIAIPPMLMMRDMHDGGERLENTGRLAWACVRVVWIVILAFSVLWLILR